MPPPPKGPPPGSFGLKVMNRLTALNVFLYRRTGGRIGAAIGNIKSIALVDHVGAKSGTKRTTPLVYTRDADDVIIVGSQGGSPKTPSWVFNLRANPRTTIQIGNRKWEVVAHEATDEERDADSTLVDAASRSCPRQGGEARSVRLANRIRECCAGLARPAALADLSRVSCPSQSTPIGP